MKITLEVPDHKAAFVMELLQSIPFIKAKPMCSKAKPQDETEYLLSTEANRDRLLQSLANIERGLTEPHELIEE